MKDRMPQKKMRNSVELTAIKRFEKCRTCPAFQNTETVFCGDWGRASTSMKPWVSAKAEICDFLQSGFCFALLAAFLCMVFDLLKFWAFPSIMTTSM